MNRRLLVTTKNMSEHSRKKGQDDRFVSETLCVERCNTEHFACRELHIVLLSLYWLVT